MRHDDVQELLLERDTLRKVVSELDGTLIRLREALEVAEGMPIVEVALKRMATIAKLENEVDALTIRVQDAPDTFDAQVERQRRGTVSLERNALGVRRDALRRILDDLFCGNVEPEAVGLAAIAQALLLFDGTVRDVFGPKS